MTSNYRRARKPEPSSHAAFGNLYGVKVGRFRIAPYRAGRIWIGEAAGGEGGEFDEKELEAVLEKFYGERF